MGSLRFWRGRLQLTLRNIHETFIETMERFLKGSSKEHKSDAKCVLFLKDAEVIEIRPRRLLILQ